MLICVEGDDPLHYIYLSLSFFTHTFPMFDPV